MKIKFYIILLLIGSTVFAQQNKVETKIDTTQNKIGAQFNLTLKTTVDSMSTVVFPRAKNFGSLEVIRIYVTDTIRNGNQFELIKKYGLTQFDPGKYTIPKLKILINKKPVYSDSIALNVQDVVVDTLQQKMYDIKPIIQVEKEPKSYWKYVFIFLLILGIGALVYWLIKKYQKKKIEAEIFKSPIEKATSLLTSLEKKELWQKGEIKTYYSELTDIARNYIEEALEIPAMESTTSELMDSLKNISIKKKIALSQETIDNLSSVLKQADLVKFAKSKPLEFEITEDRNKIQKTIITLNKAIPVEAELPEDAILNEIQRANLIKLQLRKKRNNRILISVASILFIVIITTGFFVVTKGFNYVKDNIIGHPSKELLEGEWVESEYGNPSITIQTPKVLKRMDAEKSVPKEAMALIKEMQMFAYGSLTDNFYSLISTVKFKNPTEIDLSKVLEGAVKIMESQGAKNILLKQDEYKTNDGIEGLKGFGTMTVVNPISKKENKVYYEILFFKQDQGLQQITILHQENDKYGKEIADRILKSVELKKAN